MTRKRTRSTLLTLLFGGILPVIAFAIVEEYYGVIWGTVAGMVFGFGEVIFEKVTVGRVAAITWGANALILLLGLVTILSSDGIWFKLQPAILLYCFGGIIVGSSLAKKPLLLAMSLKQNPALPERAIEFIKALNLRLGILFVLLGGLSTWAALSWETEAWAFLKSVGVMLIVLLYFALEVAIKRLKMR